MLNISSMIQTSEKKTTHTYCSNILNFNLVYRYNDQTFNRFELICNYFVRITWIFIRHDWLEYRELSNLNTSGHYFFFQLLDYHFIGFWGTWNEIITMFILFVSKNYLFFLVNFPFNYKDFYENFSKWK